MSLSYSAVASSARSRTMTVRLLKYFSTRPARPRPCAWKRVIAQPIDVELVVVLGIGDRRLQDLLDVLGDPARREGQLGERARSTLAADALGDQVELARTDADDAQERLGFSLVEAARCAFLAHR